MKKIKYIVVKGESRYLGEVERIYRQNDKNHGGYFNDVFLVPHLNRLARKENKKIYMVCALKEDKLVGFAQFFDGYVNNSLYLAVLAVDKDFRKQGIGRGLIKYGLHHSLGYKSITLEAISSNKSAVKLYERLGFKFILKYYVKGNSYRIEEQNFFSYKASRVKGNRKMEYTEIENDIVKDELDLSEEFGIEI